MTEEKNIVVGLGEIGKPIFNLISKSSSTLGYDINPELINKKTDFNKYCYSFLHLCVPFSSNFVKQTEKIFEKFNPKCLIIHSTVASYTTKIIQKKSQFQ